MQWATWRICIVRGQPHIMLPLDRHLYLFIIKMFETDKHFYHIYGNK